MFDPAEVKPATLVAQALGVLDAETGGVVPPLHMATTFARDAAYRPIGGRVYGRDQQPTLELAESVLAALEGGAGAMLFGSGMAAATAVFQGLAPGDHVVVPRTMYYALRAWLDGFAVPWGLSLSTVENDDLAALAAALRPGTTRLVWLETPANPLWTVTDIAAAAELAHGAGARLAVDSTVATPILTRPLALGADLVIHSVSKYLNGHGDVIGGAVLGSRARTRAVRSHQQAAGGIMEPFGAWLLLRGLATYPLRMERHNANGLAVAQHLAAHPAVARVHYPGLPQHPDHALAARQMDGFGGLVSFEAAGGPEAARRIVDACRLFAIGPSIGGIESLISQPGNTSHHSVPPEERARLGIPPSLVRLCVGIETAEDLIADLDRALEAA